jgi:hypothetical protein
MSLAETLQTSVTSQSLPSLRTTRAVVHAQTQPHSLFQGVQRTCSRIAPSFNVAFAIVSLLAAFAAVRKESSSPETRHQPALSRYVAASAGYPCSRGWLRVYSRIPCCYGIFSSPASGSQRIHLDHPPISSSLQSCRSGSMLTATCAVSIGPCRRLRPTVSGKLRRAWLHSRRLTPFSGCHCCRDRVVAE